MSKIYNIFIAVLKKIFTKSTSTIYGEARFMNKSELKRHFSKSHKGLILSHKYRLSLDESFKNLCLIAPTGSGKTTRYVIPNILNCSGSLVVTDPSGEIYTKTARHMRKRGYTIQVLEPANLARSLQANTLSHFHTHQELKQVATTLGVHNAGSDNFWVTGSINIMYICLVALKADDPNAHIGKLRGLLNKFGVEDSFVENFMKKNLDDSTFDEYKAFLAQDEKVITSILSSARVAVDLWSDPDVVRFSQANTVDIKALRDKKTIIYIIVPEHKIKYFSIIINLFYSSCFEYCMKHPQGNPVFYFLDEFGNLGKIPNFSTIATTLRKTHCSLNLILQELSQLNATYGRDEAQSIYSGGMANKLFFSGLDLQSCKYLEQILGSNTKYDTVTVSGDIRLDDQVRTVSTPLMRLDEIRMLPDDEAILISGSKKPAKFRMIPYYKDSKLLKLVD